MGFRINTNIAAMDAHRNASNNNVGLDKSLASLSSGLRINKAADDASGLAIANSLRAQSTGLGQAISNANDGIGVAQTADGALEEYGTIINTIRTKAIQAASDGQNSDSRAAIQRDIDKLLEAADSIANTTQFNGQNLLDGTFTNKAFHIGAYAGETVNISVDSTKTADLGNITAVNNEGATIDGLATWAALTAGNISETSGGYVLKSNEIKVNGFDVAGSLNTLSPTRLQDGKNLAAAITDATGLLADATTKVNGVAVAGAVLTAGATLTINGFSIDVASKTIAAGDSDGLLQRLINDVSDKTGVTAENVGGKLVLTANDGRNIAIGGGSTALTAGGLTSSVTSKATVATATLSTTAVAAITYTTGQLVINGVDMAGTYGNGVTAGSAGTALLNAIKDIDGMETSTLAAGVLTLTVNNGDDLNIAGSAIGLAGGTMAEGVTNSSTKGVVNIYSEDKVTIGGTDPLSFGFTAGAYTPKDTGTALDDVDVTSRESAEVAILIADKALKNLDEIRSNIGSTQNQLESTIRNISVTKVNVSAAESQIRDVDFAAESANFAKHNILAQSGAYAMSQANAVQQNVLRLLQ